MITIRRLAMHHSGAPASNATRGVATGGRPRNLVQSAEFIVRLPAPTRERIMRRGNLVVLCLATGLAVVPAATRAGPLGPSQRGVAIAQRAMSDDLLTRARLRHRRGFAVRSWRGFAARTWTGQPTAATETPPVRDIGSASWAGSVFWPSAYTDTVGYILLGGQHAGFWAHGYADIYAAMLGSGMAYAVASDRDGSAPEISCRESHAEVGSTAIARFGHVLELTDSQSARLDDLRTALGKAGERLTATCPKVAELLAPTSRLGAMWERLRALRHAVGMVRLPLRDFYSSLSDEQKAQLDAASSRAPDTRPRSRSATVLQLVAAQEGNACTAGGAGAPDWPGADIEAVIRPGEGQRNLWEVLNGTSAKLPDILKPSCPTEMPFTPTGRLDAVEDRLDGLIYAVTIERSALSRLYMVLNDEQKARLAAVLTSPHKHDGATRDQRATATTGTRP